MTREEERLKASVAYNEQHGKLNVIGGYAILSDEERLYFNQNPAFIAGVEWADAHPRKGLVDIDKVCDWMKNYRQESSDGTGYVPGIVNDKTIEEFRKAMEL